MWWWWQSRGAWGRSLFSRSLSLSLWLALCGLWVATKTIYIYIYIVVLVVVVVVFAVVCCVVLNIIDFLLLFCAASEPHIDTHNIYIYIQSYIYMYRDFK